MLPPEDSSGPLSFLAKLVLHDIKMVAREDCRLGQKMTYSSSFLEDMNHANIDWHFYWK